MLSLFILFEIIIKCNAEYKLVFSDEFNQSDSIDQNKWDVQHEDKYCDGNYIQQLNCKTNSTDNLQIINGTLVLAAIRQKYLNKEYTSPLITTKKSFTYGKFEIRAALPKGKMLRTVISLTPTILKEGELWSTSGQVDILVHQQDQLLVHGLHGTKNNKHKWVPGNDELVVKENLNNFHVYEMEWSNNWMTWSFDRKLLTKKSFTKEFQNNPFDKPFKLRIILGVGGQNFDHQTLTPQDSKNWNCSLLILDYVRVYQKTEQNSIVRDIPEENSISSVDICDNVMKLVRNIDGTTPQPTPSTNTDGTTPQPTPSTNIDGTTPQPTPSTNIDGTTPQPISSSNNSKIVAIIAISNFLLLLAITV